MKTLKVLATAALAVLACTALAVEPPYNIQVAATAANTVVTFGFKPCEIIVTDDGANESFVRWDAAAVAAGTTSIQIPAYRGKRFTFAEGRGPSTMGVICSGAETATVRVEAYQCDSGHAPDVTDFAGPSAYVAGAITSDTMTTTGAAVVGSTLAVGTNATVTGTLTQTGIATFTAAPVMSALTASRLVVTGAGKALASNGAITTNAIPKSASSGATLADSSVSDNGSVVTVTSESVNVTGAYIQGKLFIAVPQVLTVADNAGGTPAAGTLLPTSSVVLITCNDGDGCTITMDETGAVTGEVVRIVNMSVNACTFADTAGLSETSGALSLGQYDAVSFLYATDRFVQLHAVENN